MSINIEHWLKLKSSLKYFSKFVFYILLSQQSILVTRDRPPQRRFDFASTRIKLRQNVAKENTFRRDFSSEYQTVYRHAYREFQLSHSKKCRVNNIFDGDAWDTASLTFGEINFVKMTSSKCLYWLLICNFYEIPKNLCQILAHTT